jgi:hypothetical protein
VENGRTYHAYNEGSMYNRPNHGPGLTLIEYMMPNDEDEQARLGNLALSGSSVGRKF